MRDIYNNYEKAIVGTKKMNTAVRKMLNNKTIITNLLQWIDTLDE